MAHCRRPGRARGLRQRESGFHFLWIIAFVLLIPTKAGRAASEHHGQVTVGTVAVPGATVTASQADKRVVTSTDPEGVVQVRRPGRRRVDAEVEMIGFAPVSQDVTVAPDSPPSMWELKLRPFEEIAREVPASAVEPPPSSSTAATRRHAAGDRPSACRAGRRVSTRRRQRVQCPGRPGDGGRGSGGAAGGRFSAGCRRRIARQRQREQRRGFAVRAARGVRQQPPRRPVALHRRRRRRSSAIRRGMPGRISFTSRARRSPTTTTCRSSAPSAAR